MQIFDLKALGVHSFDEREKNIIYNVDEFKVRIIKLQAGGKIPDCNMPSYVMFYVIDGSVDVTVNQEKKTIYEGQCLINEPATISMNSKDGAKLMGIQIATKKEE